MTKKVVEDPEILDDPEEGLGDLFAVGNQPLPAYDSSQFQVPEDFDSEEDDE